MLNARQTRFVQEYCVDFNATQAAIRAGYSENGAANHGYELLRNAEIADAITERKDDLAKIAEIDSTWILKRYREIADADPNELVRVERAKCCRCCWGVEFKHQWTQEEFMIEVLAGNEPDGSGGFGFDATATANPDCPHCKGGHTRVVVSDTRRLKGSSRRLYAGAKQTKDGIEIKMRDQDAALAFLAKYKGMIVERSELSGPGGGPVPLAGLTAKDFTEEQLAAIVAGGVDIGVKID